MIKNNPFFCRTGYSSSRLLLELRKREIAKQNGFIEVPEDTDIVIFLNEKYHDVTVSLMTNLLLKLNRKAVVIKEGYKVDDYYLIISPTKLNYSNEIVIDKALLLSNNSRYKIELWNQIKSKI